jgi:hypothetical protein
LADAKQWIEIWGRDFEARFVLVELLLSDWGTLDGFTELRPAAERWAVLHEEEDFGGPAISIGLSLSAGTDHEAIALVDSAKGWVDSHLDNPAAASVLRALLAKYSGDERIRDFVADRAVHIAQHVGGMGVRRLLALAMTLLPLGHPRRRRIKVQLDQLRL